MTGSHNIVKKIEAVKKLGSCHHQTSVKKLMVARIVVIVYVKLQVTCPL